MITEVDAILANPFHSCDLDERETQVCELIVEGWNIGGIAIELKLSRSQAYNVLNAALKKISAHTGREITKDTLAWFVLERIKEAIAA